MEIPMSLRVLPFFAALPLLLSPAACCSEAPNQGLTKCEAVSSSDSRLTQTTAGPFRLKVCVSDTEIPLGSTITMRAEVRNEDASLAGFVTAGLAIHPGESQVMCLDGLKASTIYRWLAIHPVVAYRVRFLGPFVHTYDRDTGDPEWNSLLLRGGDCYVAEFLMKTEFIGEFHLAVSYENSRADIRGRSAWQGKITCDSASVRVMINQEIFEHIRSQMEGSKDERIRARMIGLLANNRITPAIPTILRLSENDPSSDVRNTALWALRLFAEDDMEEELLLNGGAGISELGLRELAKDYLDRHPEVANPSPEYFQELMKALETEAQLGLDARGQ